MTNQSEPFAMPTAWRQGLNALRRELGAQALLLGQEVPVRNHSDWSLQPPVAPLALARPSDTLGVALVLQQCHAIGLPVVPQGGLTGLSGGAQPTADALVLSLERLVGIEEIDAANATLTVRAGTPLEQVQQVAKQAGLMFPLDLGARGSCSIGGNLATNAGGNRVIRYGMARDLVLGLEVVLADGTVVNGLRKMIKNNAGYDLRHLFIGSEGTLGVITRAVLRLVPQPACVATALCALPDFGALVNLLTRARQSLGPMLSAFEVMWPDYWQAATERVGQRSPLTGEHGIYALIEIEGSSAADAQRFEHWLSEQIEMGYIADAALAQSQSDAQDFWSLRDACAEFPRVIGEHVSYDIGLPLNAMEDFVQTCKAALIGQIPGCESVCYGHIGDGNLHIDVWVSDCPGTRQPKKAMDEVVYALVHKYEGSISAEHGVGTIKRDWLHLARNPEELILMHKLKFALDPRNILNPGKVLTQSKYDKRHFEIMTKRDNYEH